MHLQLSQLQLHTQFSLDLKVNTLMYGGRAKHIPFFLLLMISFAPIVRVTLGFKSTTTKLFVHNRQDPTASILGIGSVINRAKRLYTVSTDSQNMVPEYPFEMTEDERYLFDLNGFLIVR